MPRFPDEKNHPLNPSALDPVHAALPFDEREEAWWRGTDEEAAWKSGDDVEYAYDQMFTEGLNNRSRTDEQWARVAYFLAAGVTVTEVARHFGLSRSTIWRAMQRSPGLRRRILAERNMLKRETDSRFVAMRHAVVEGLQRAITAGNVRALIWAANRLDLGGELLTEQPREDHPIRRPHPRPAPSDIAPSTATPSTATPAPPVTPAPTKEPLPPPLPELSAEPVVADSAPAQRAPLLAAPARPPVARTRRWGGPMRRIVPATRSPMVTWMVRRPWLPVRHLLTRLRPSVRLAQKVDDMLVPFPAGLEARLPQRVPAANAATPINPYRPLASHKWPT